MPLEWSLDDGNGLPAACGQGWTAPGREAGCGQRREGVQGPPPRCLLEQPHLLISGQNCRLMPSSWKLGSAVGTTSTLRLPALASASLQCPSSAELLPACLPPFFLPRPNRLRQQDGTNLWLNSPKITRDLSKAVCVKLTGVCTLLSNALSPKAPATLPQPHHSPSTNPAPPCLAFALKLPGRPEKMSTAHLALVPGGGWDRDLMLSVHHHPTDLVLGPGAPCASHCAGPSIHLAPGRR